MKTRIFQIALFCGLFLLCLSTAPAQEQGASPAWTKGNLSAKVKIEVFNDYQCPSCAVYQKTLSEIEQKFGSEVLLIYRNYPLNFHKNSMTAAQAAEAAGKQGKFFEMVNLLYEKQKIWSSAENAGEIFAKYAEEIGLDVGQFASDFSSQGIIERINADKKRGDSLKIRATPTVFLNGKMLLPDEMETEKLSGLIKEKLQN